MNSIGGYFELELKRNESFIHSDGILVNSGRNAFEYILRVMDSKPDIIWLPYYTCDVMLQPLNRLGLNYKFYPINENFEIDEWPIFNENEYIVINNYFGIKDKYIKELAADPNKAPHIIIDNSQAWFSPAISGIRQFYSPRKFFGVPDGGVAYTIDSTRIELERSTSFDSCLHLLKRIDLGPQDGYLDYRKNEIELDKSSLKSMSNLTRLLLASIDDGYVKIKRRSNYEYISSQLDSTNLLSLPNLNSFECPMVCPYLSKNPNLKKRLLDNDIFIATYWPNILNTKNLESIEYKLAKNLVAIPIDQRYNENDMKRIIAIIKEYHDYDQ